MRKQERSEGARQGIDSQGGPHCWDEVDRRLARLGEIGRKLEMLQGRLERKVAELKQQMQEASRELEEEQDRLREEIEQFYWAQRKEVLAAGRKSVELVFGRLGSRRSCRLVVEDPAAVQQWLAAQGLESYLRTRTEIDREAIRSALLAGNGSRNGEAAALASCPAIRLQEREEFWYEVHLAGGNAAARAASDGRALQPALNASRQPAAGNMP